MPKTAALLLRQGGVARRRDLLSAGLSRRALERAVTEGAVRQLAPRVLGLAADVEHEALRTALAQTGGIASHQDAALLWGLELALPGTGRHVTVPRCRSGRSSAGVTAHRADVPAVDVQVRAGIPLTSVVRTLFDLCRALPLAEAVVAVDSALRRRLVTAQELAGALSSLPGGRGRPRVRAVLALVDPASGSVLESLCRVLLVRAGLTPPATQLEVRGSRGVLVGRVDFAWPEARLVVEVDGFAFHADRDSYRADRRRTNELVLAGWRVLRFSWEDVVGAPERVITAVRHALAA